MDADLKNLQIDRSKRRTAQPSRWATRTIIAGVALFVLLGLWRFLSAGLNSAPEVETQRVRALSAASAPQGVVLNATGYIVAAHKIEVAAKVVGKVKWIGVDKGDKVREGQVLVRLEDDEYRAQRGAQRNPGGPARSVMTRPPAQPRATGLIWMLS